SLLRNAFFRSHRLGKEAVGTRLRDSHPDNVTDFTGLFINNYGLEPWRTADPLAGLPAGLFDQQFQLRADEGGCKIPLLPEQQRLELLEPLVLHLLLDVRTEIGPR